MSKDPQKLVIHGTKVLRATDNPLFSGWEEVPDFVVVNTEPGYKWKGNKIPYQIWAQVVGFMRWSQQKFKAEAMVSFFYNTATGEWAVWPFPQEPMGMTVRYLENHPMYAEDRKQFGKDWIQFGSLHHHCTAAAFASGTDKDDEKDRDGIHITLGKLDENVLDVHCRQTFDGVVTTTKLLDWIEIPDYLAGAPVHLVHQFADFALRAIREHAFPEIWKERIMERVYPSHHHGHHQQPNFQGDRRQAKQPTQGTVLTRTGPGAAFTEIDADTRKALGSHYEKAMAKLNDWEKRMANRLEVVLTALAMTSTEAYELIRHVPDSKWPEDEVMWRTELVQAMNREGIPHLYAEGILKKMQELAASTP